VVDVAFKAAAQLAFTDGGTFDAGPLHALQDTLRRWFAASDRISAQAINRKFVDWLARRRQPERPFFVFLNYIDVHTPYLPPTIAGHRFGPGPQSVADLKILGDWRDLNKLELPPYFQTLASDAYDNCLAYLDGQLGKLFLELQRRGEFDRTWVIVTSDHGEGLGEHDLYFHGESLYRTEVGVPLLIVAPESRRSQVVVSETVSLRSLPATIVELVGLAANSPFPGPSLADVWRRSLPDRGSTTIDNVISELTGPNPSDPNQGRSPAKRGPLVSLAEGDFVYIRNEGDGAEELFNERDDPGELRNQAGIEALQPVLKRFRERVHQLRTRR
jgi:arylsulfatase A-like enzyme